MREWRPFAQDARESWERFVFLVRDARAHQELRYIPVVVGGSALWATFCWFGTEYAGVPRLSALPMIGLVAGIPAAFMGAIAWDLRRWRKRAAEDARAAVEQATREHSFTRNDLRTYRLVAGKRAQLHGLPGKDSFRELAYGPDQQLYGIDHDEGMIRPARLPDAQEEAKFYAEEAAHAQPPPLPKGRRHSKYKPLT